MFALMIIPIWMYPYFRDGHFLVANALRYTVDSILVYLQMSPTLIYYETNILKSMLVKKGFPFKLLVLWGHFTNID